MNTVSSRTPLLLLAVLALSGCALLGLSGCALLGKGAPAPRLYTLNAAPSVPVTRDAPERMNATLRVAKPQAAPGLETERIALRKSANQLDYYADARWAGDVATLLQASLVERLEAGRQFKGVSNDLVALQSDYNLLIDIRDFQVDRKDGQAQAHVAFSAKLVDIADDRVIQNLRYDEFVPVNADDLQSVVAGFDAAQQRATEKLAADMTVALMTVSLQRPQTDKPAAVTPSNMTQ